MKTFYLILATIMLFVAFFIALVEKDYSKATFALVLSYILYSVSKEQK